MIDINRRHYLIEVVYQRIAIKNYVFELDFIQVYQLFWVCPS
jgi:hypothetical protein